MMYNLGASKTQIAEFALTELFGQAWSYHCAKVPYNEVFPAEIRHFDSEGLHLLVRENPVVMVYTPTGIPVQVSITSARCGACNFLYYRVEGIYSIEGELIHEFG